jgi:cytochrome c oxidase cbb3-type subunit 4
MDINTVRGLITLVLMLAFVAMVVWLVFGTRAKDFESVASLPLMDDETDAKGAGGSN